MAVSPRYLEPAVREDLTRRMVFVAGARQVGKTPGSAHLDGNAAALPRPIAGVRCCVNMQHVRP